MPKEYRKKAKAALVLAAAKPPEEMKPSVEDHAKPPEVQTMQAFCEALDKGEYQEALHCLEALFRHFDAGPHEESTDEDEEDGKAS